MAIVQIGYLGGVGPLFVDDANASAGGKKILLQGQTSSNGASGLYAKQPAYAANINLTPSEYSLGPYADNQRVSDIPAFKQPVNGGNFSGYDTNVSAMVNGTTVPGSTTTTTTGGTTTTTTGGTTTTTGGTVTTTDTSHAAPTLLEQITTFVTNYWWLIALILFALLWKPFIAPFFGMGKKRRR